MAAIPLLWRNWSQILCQRCRAIRSMANRCVTESIPMEHSCFIQSAKTEWMMAEIHLQLLIRNQNPFRGKKAVTWFGHSRPHRPNDLMKPQMDANENEAGRDSMQGAFKKPRPVSLTPRFIGGVGRGLCLLTLSKGFHRTANWFRAFLNPPWGFMARPTSPPPAQR